VSPGSYADSTGCTLTPVFEYWADRLRADYASQIDVFAQFFSNRVLPGFANIDEEGKQIAKEAYREMSSAYGMEDDFGSLAEMAQDHAITYYETMCSLQQGVINMFSVGLWHLFEQQLADFARHAILRYPLRLKENPNFGAVRTLLRNEWNVDITQFLAYGQVEELRLLANCAKHGDGDSCSRLRVLRPALFNPLRNEAGFGLGPGPVIAPLGGEHLYLAEEDFKAYADAVKGFLIELSERVRALATRP